MREFKYSGIEWIGKIPKDWERIKLLYCLRQPICDGPHETPDYIKEGIPFISVDSLNDSKIIDFSVVKKFISENDYQEYLKKANLQKNDILFSKAATIGKTAIVGNEKFMVWSPLAIIKNNPNVIDNTYLYYLLNCEHLITFIRLSGSHNTQANVGMREMERANIPLPPKEEQVRIADYLDTKCEQIDLIASGIANQISTLESYKKSLITETVTKGLNRDVEYKESEVEWLGKIPSHWEVKRLKYIAKNRKQKVKNNEGNDYFALENIVSWNGQYIETENAYDTTDSVYCYKDDVALGKLRPYLAKVFHVDKDRCCSTEFAVFYDFDGISRYYFYTMLSDAFINKIDSETYGIKMPRVNIETLNNMYLPQPSYVEQQEIADYLDERCSKIDEILELKRKQLDTLNEYKKSLIYEYVTGKKEVK